MRKQWTKGLALPLGDALSQGMERDREDRLWASICARRADGLEGRSARQRPGRLLPVPLCRVLRIDDFLGERSGLWRRIRARQLEARRDARGLRWPALGFGLAAALGAALVLTAIVPLGRRVAVPAAALRPLTLANGFALTAMEAAHGPRVVTLADTSEIRLDPGARVETLLLSGSSVELLLRRGSAEFAVKPGGPRRWVIEAGIATVEVVGTVFRVSRGPQGVQVSVSRGTVLVRGEAVPDRVRRLTTGQGISVAPPPASPAPSTVLGARNVGAGPGGDVGAGAGPGSAGAVGASAMAPSAGGPGAGESGLGEDGVTVEGVEASAGPAGPIDATEAPHLAPQSDSVAAPAPATAAGSAARTPGAAAWRRALARGRYKEAYSTLGVNGLVREVSRTDHPQRLLELADVARLSGHPADAVAPLRRLMTRHARSPQAGLAAFTLGRVYLDQLDAPSEAAQAFEQAIELRPPNALLADCHARLVEAYARAGDDSRAKRAASRYRVLFPFGQDPSAPAIGARP